MPLRSNEPRAIELWARERKTWPDRIALYTVATLPDPVEWRGGLIIVTDETGGEVLAWSDGTNWRRSTDRAVVS
jgi:hypothetical protein